MDSAASLTGNWWQLSPSVFLLTRADDQGVKAAEGDFFACPACGEPLQDTPPVLRCSKCKHEYPIKDGIYDFRLNPPTEAS